MNRKLLIIGVVAIGLLLVGNAYLYVIQPKLRADDYSKTVKTDLASLLKLSKEMERTTNAPLFNDPDLSVAQTKASVTDIRKTIAELKKEMDSVEANNNAFKPSTVVSTLAIATDATSIHDRLPRTLSQTREVLKNYEALLSYTEQRAVLDVQLRDALNEFNTITDYDALSPTTPIIQRLNSTTTRLAKEFNALPAPKSLQQNHVAAAQTYDQAATAISLFTTAIARPTEVTVGAAALKVEAVTRQHEETDKYTYFDALIKQSALNDVTQLSEKFASY